MMQMEEQSLSLEICAGSLVKGRPCERGILTFLVAMDGEDVRLTLRLTGFTPRILGTCPSRLRKWLYRLTQAHIHKIVTIRFLSTIYREMTGIKPCIRLVNAKVADGEPI